LSLPPFESDHNFQQELEDFRQLHGNLALWEKLADIDPEYAREIHPNSYPYVCRGIEVKMRTGKSKKEFRTERKSLYNTKWHWTFDGDRESLYNRINTRVEGMFADGWVQEVETLL
jgi:tRNA dimethylallyltransferase